MKTKHARFSSSQKRLTLLGGAASLVALIAALSALLMNGSQTAHAGSLDEQSGARSGPLLVRKAEMMIVPPQSALRSRLQVAAVSASAQAHSVSLPGVVEADPARTVNILPPLAGRLMELRVKLGDVVKAGQVLALISAPDLAQAYADFDKARDARELARRALQRAHGVHDAGANAAKDLEQAESSDVQAQAELTRADARLKTLNSGGKLDASANLHVAGSAAPALRLTAPISGTVTALNLGAGSYINDPTAALMTIANLEQVWVTANVPENLIASVSKGQGAEVRLAAYPAQLWHGVIGFVSTVLEADTRRNKARIAFANPDGKLKPNMYASVSLNVPQAAQITVASSALLMNNDSTTVFVEVAPWTFVRRVVEIGAEDGDSVRILSGLKAHERVVVRGGVLLND